MKGHLIRKENSWWVRTETSIEGDDVVFVDYPLSLTSSYYAGFSLKEGKEVNFEIETEIYIEGYTHLGEMKIDWAVIKSPITRLEIINHKSNEHPIGRIFTYYGNVEVSMQDNNKTLKIFI
jgi:hypothetical protein